MNNKKIFTGLVVAAVLLGVFWFWKPDCVKGADSQQVINKISQAIAGGVQEVDLQSYQISLNEISAMAEKAAAQSQLYVESYQQIGFIYSYTSSLSYVFGLKIKYGMDSNTASQRQKALQAKINEIKKKISPNMSDLEKALVVHDLLVEKTHYDESMYEKYGNGQDYVPHDDFTAYGPLVLGKGVCSGYTRAYELVLRELGIPVQRVKSSIMNHEWNLVKIGNSWYHVDLTWDDQKENGESCVKHNHFMKNDSEMRALGYSLWSSQYQAVSKKYSNWVFNDSKTAIGYQNGFWISGKGTNVIRAKINGSSQKVLKEKAVYIGCYQNRIYYIDQASFEIRSCLADGTAQQTVYQMKNKISYPKNAKINTTNCGEDGKITVTIVDYKQVSANVLTPLMKKITYKIGSLSAANPVNLKKVSLTSVTAKKGKLAMKWKKVSGCAGYEICESKKQISGYKKITTIKKGKTITFTKNFSKKGIYYYKIRAYKTVSGKTYYGEYSSVKKIKVS